VCALHLAGGDPRFLVRAVDDLDEAQYALAGLELARATAVADAAAALGLSEDECTLGLLASLAPSSVQLVFEGFRNKSATLLHEIEDLRGLSEQVATRAVAVVIDRLERITMTPVSLTYGEPVPGVVRASSVRVNQAL
jgi:hypothetical protein